MDYIILGAGPAGLQLGHFLKESNRDYLILESGDGPGTFFKRFPRHRRLISINKRYTESTDPEVCLRTDWNSLLSTDDTLRFTRYSDRYFPDAEDMVQYLEDYARRTGVRVRYNMSFRRITHNGKFELHDADGGTWSCKRLIVATGLSRPFVPDIPGIELAHNYCDVRVDPAAFRGRRVLIIGKGNSAFETADNLIETAATIHVAGPKSVTLAWRSHYVGHVRAVNNNFLDTYQLKSENAIIDGTIQKIERDGPRLRVTASFARADELHKEIPYDDVIVCTGFRFDDSIFDDTCRPALTIFGKFPEQTAAWESTNVRDLFFAGTLMQARDYRRSTSGFIHGFRYCVRALHRMLEARYHRRPWPAPSLAAESGELTRKVIERVNRTSALWQEFAFLCDVIKLEGDAARYLEELPLDYVRSQFGGPQDRLFTVTLEYGADHDKVDPFDIRVGRITQSDSGRAADARYLHPVVRHWCAGRIVAEHHLTENLENRWDHPEVHERPLQTFFAQRLWYAATVPGNGAGPCAR
jgi:thioredoxin reductase